MEKQKTQPLGSGRVSEVFALGGAVDFPDLNENPSENLAAVVIAIRHRLTLSTAREICRLAGLGGRRA